MKTNKKVKLVRRTTATALDILPVYVCYKPDKQFIILNNGSFVRFHIINVSSKINLKVPVPRISFVYFYSVLVFVLFFVVFSLFYWFMQRKSI